MVGPDVNGVVVVVVHVRMGVNPCDEVVGVADGGKNDVRVPGRSGVLQGEVVDIQGGVEGLGEEVGEECLKVLGELAHVGGEVDGVLGRGVAVSEALLCKSAWFTLALTRSGAWRAKALATSGGEFVGHGIIG